VISIFEVKTLLPGAVGGEGAGGSSSVVDPAEEGE